MGAYFKKRRHKLDPKSQEMIFVGYKPGSKGYQHWDAAHQHFKISCDVKFEETLFPAKEAKLKISNLVPLSDQPISESDNESDNSGLDLVIPAQPPTRPPSPDQSASRQTVQEPQTQTHLNPPIAPPWVPTGEQPSRSGQEPAMPEAPHPLYSLCPTKEQLACQPQPSGDSINNILIHMLQEAPNSYQEVLNSEESMKWLAASQEEFDGLTEMGVWKLVDCPSDHKTIKCRWTYILKYDGRYKARLPKDICKSKG